MVKDPTCGMQVDEKKAAGHVVYEGTTYYFCSPGCMKRFQEDPGKFVTRSQSDWDRR